MDKAVRGSPIIRTLFVALFLALTAFGLARMTRERIAEPVNGKTPEPTAVTATKPVPFQLQLSAPAVSVAIHDAQGNSLYEQTFAAPQSECSGQLSTMPSALVLTVKWQEAAAQPRYFAKLRLEPSGSATLTQVFDSPSHIDDIWELP